MLLGGDEMGAVEEGNFGFGGGKYAVYLLAVDTNGGDPYMCTHLAESMEYIIKTHRLPGVLFESHDRETAVFQYVGYKWHFGLQKYEKKVILMRKRFVVVSKFF
jgi:hypothetical protein